MIRFFPALGLAVAMAGTPVAAADLARPVPTGRFRATCEDLGKLCFAQACGRDQIDAALGCRAQCPSSAVMSVVPDPCPLVAAPGPVILRRRG
jgi:hypothetical protein